MCMYQFEDWPGILAGCILGDGYIRINRIITSHTNPQRDYVLFKNSWFLGLGLRSRTRMDYWSNTNLGVYQYSEVAVIMPDKRLINLSPEQLIHTLNPFGLLLWWLDDGSLSIHVKENKTSVSRFGYLNTQNFDYNANLTLSKALHCKFGIETRIHTDTQRGKVYYRLYLNAINMRRLIDIVRDMIQYIPCSMLYKLNMGYVPNRMSASLELSNSYNF